MVHRLKHSFTGTGRKAPQIHETYKIHKAPPLGYERFWLRRLFSGVAACKCLKRLQCCSFVNGQPGWGGLLGDGVAPVSNTNELIGSLS